MNTFSKMFGVSRPIEIKQIIQKEIEKANIGEPKNLEEQAIKMVGTTIYEKLIKGYTEKQWSKSCKELSPDIIKRLPLRFTYNNNYFNDKYQGIPETGYTKMIEKMFEGADFLMETDFMLDKDYFESLADKVYYSGCIDEYYEYRFGSLEYRGLRFVNRTMTSITELQGVAVMNFTDSNSPQTRRIQHWYFNQDKLDKKLADHKQLFRGTETYEYPADWQPGDTPYYPVNNERNADLYERYHSIPNEKVTFCGRLGQYKYYDMDDTIAAALEMCK
jgi:UDP-galactopyranose mutase